MPDINPVIAAACTDKRERKDLYMTLRTSADLDSAIISVI